MDFRARWAAWALLLAALLVTANASLRELATAEAEARHEFAAICLEVQAHIVDRVRGTEQVLRRAAAFMADTNGSTRGGWRDYVGHQEVDRKYPGTQGLGFAQVVPGPQLGQHLQHIRAEGFPDYRIWPVGERAEYSAIIFLEPFAERNLRAFGYDMLTEPVRRAAMEQARDQNQVVLAGQVALVQETGVAPQAGTLIYAPVYRRGASHETTATRRAAAIGWVYSPWRMTDLLQGILGRLHPLMAGRIQLQIFDDGKRSSENMLYDSAPRGDPRLVSAGGMVQQSLVDLAGRRWLLRFTELGGASRMVDYRRVWLVLGGGTSISLLLFSLMRSVTDARSATQIMAGQVASLTQTEGRLRASEERYRAMFEGHAAVQLVIHPDSGAIIDANDAAARFYGWTRGELTRMHIQQINTLPTETVMEKLKKAAGGEQAKFEFCHRRADGSIREVEVFSNQIRTGGESVVYSIVQDITERRQATLALELALQEKTALLLEIHHRVKNNLQIVASLLGLQSRSIQGQEAASALQNVADRINSMALLHEALYRSGNFSRIDFASYVEELCGHLLSSIGTPTGQVRLERQVHCGSLSLDQSVPCGLIINELVSNSLKHAFPGDRGGRILVELSQPDARHVVLRVSDDGQGLADGFDPAKACSLGLRLIANLAQQLGGRCVFERPAAGGAAFQVAFPFMPETRGSSA